MMGIDEALSIDPGAYRLIWWNEACRVYRVSDLDRWLVVLGEEVAVSGSDEEDQEQRTREVWTNSLEIASSICGAQVESMKEGTQLRMMI